MLINCRPILTPKTVLPLFFAVGIIFGPIGGALLYASALVRYSKTAHGGMGGVFSELTIVPSRRSNKSRSTTPDASRMPPLIP
jgi:hypothetical protein